MMYYFGCWNQAGHFLHDVSGHRMYQRVGPFESGDLDTTFAPRRAPNYAREDDTITNLVYTNGWTVLAMWDNSIDTRGKSNAVFLIEGGYSTEEMWQKARESYPQIYKRLKAAQAYESNYLRPRE